VRSLAVSVSIAVHVLLLLLMNMLPDRASVAAPHIVEMNVKRVPPPPPPPKEEPEVEEPPPPPEVRPKKVKTLTVKKSVPDAPKPEPREPPKEETAPPKGFSVDMSNTSEAGNVAVPAREQGGNMFANPNDKTLAPGEKTEVRPPPPVERGRGRGTAPAGAYQVTSDPEFIGSEVDRTPPYPESAKAHEIEGQVLLNVYVGSSGRVEEVRFVRKLEASCDKVALEWAKRRWRFKPAMAGGQAVGMWITVPVTFVLER
jgi:periplasmic protein TonB